MQPQMNIKDEKTMKKLNIKLLNNYYPFYLFGVEIIIIDTIVYVKNII